MDEGYTVNAVLSIIEKGKSLLDSGQYYGCPTYCYPSALSAHFFGIDNPASYRAFAAIAGIVFIFAIYMVAKKWFGNKVALIATFFIAFSYWQIAWSREARWYTLLELFFWLALYFFYELLRSMKKHSPSVILNESEGSPCAVSTKSVIPASPSVIPAKAGILSPSAIPIFYSLLTTLFTVLAILTHSEAYLLLPIFTIWTIYTVLSNTKIHIKKKVFITSVSILLLTLIALFADSLGLHFLKPLLTTLDFHYSLPYYLSFYLRNYWLFIIFTIIGLSTTPVILSKAKDLPAPSSQTNHSSLPTFLLFIFSSYLLAFGLFSDLVHYRYLFLVTPALYILGAYGMVETLKLIKHKLWRVVFFLVFITIFFISGHGVAVPQTNYQLESDDPSSIKGRPYYAYTPQSNFKGAYAYVKEQKSNEEIVISAHPTFNKIYLGEAGFWLSYGYLGIGDRNSYTTADSREYYVGAKIIGNLGGLQEITSQNHGYIIYDYYATQGRIAKEELEYISENFKLVYEDESSSFSKIWVYRF